MSEEAYAAAAISAAAGKVNESDDTGICCRNLSPFTRKVGYYGTFALGFLTFFFGVISIFTFSTYLLVTGSTIILFCPLWVKSPCDLIKAYKNPLRLSSLLIFLLFFVLSIIAMLFDWKLLSVVAGIGLAISGIWYFLSYFENGQQACVNCLKTCMKNEDQQKSQTSTDSGMGQTEESA